MRRVSVIEGSWSSPESSYGCSHCESHENYETGLTHNYTYGKYTSSGYTSCGCSHCENRKDYDYDLIKYVCKA